MAFATKKQKTLMVVDKRESVYNSWLRDGFSFGILMLTAWFLNTQMPPSGWLNFMLCALWLLWMISRGARHRFEMNADEARQWLDENYPSNSDQSPQGEDP